MENKEIKELIDNVVGKLAKKQKVAQLEAAIKEDVAWGFYGL